MKLKYTVLTVFSVTTLAACVATGGNSASGGSTDMQISAATDMFKAATVSDDELKSASLQYRQAADKQMKVAPASSKYAKRLAKLSAKHLNEDGLTLNFKVYIVKDINANAIKYVRRIEELIGAPVALLSTSPERDDTILMRDPFQG